jgi:N-formylglutamate amidohydrolase
MIPQEYEEHLLNLWHNHQERLRNNLCPEALLMDCHSFPSEMSDVDICIGYNEDWSKPNKETIELAVNLFEDCGYKVGINEPYSNSETPECPFIYQSMMLEVNKKTYMEDGSLRLKKNLSYRKTIHDLVTTLMSELSV